MARYADRPLQWMDILGRFESRSHQAHTRDALACLGRINDEGRQFWPDGSTELRRWERGCKELRAFLNSLNGRRNVENQDLGTVMREFVQAFEHHTGRMYQLLYGAHERPDEDQRVGGIFEWFNLAFRFSIYALLSGWLDDKHEETVIRTAIDMEIEGDTATVTVSQESEHKEMTIPKKYRQAANRI